MKKYLAILPFSLISFNEINTLNSQSVTVSGFSSGAMMASHLLISSSEMIKGAGLISGGPYYCSKGTFKESMNCVKNTKDIDIKSLVELTKNFEDKKLIDPLDNLKHRFVYILNEKKETVGANEAGLKSYEFLQNFIPKKNIKTKFDIKSGHSLPSLNKGNPCDSQYPPWVNNCNYDTVKHLLEFVTKKKLKSSKSNLENLYQIDLSDLIVSQSQMNTIGLIYVPKKCLKINSKKNVTCDLHVVFHGCRQSLDEAGLDFIKTADYNNWQF